MWIDSDKVQQPNTSVWPNTGPSYYYPNWQYRYYDSEGTCWISTATETRRCTDPSALQGGVKWRISKPTTICSIMV